MRPASASSTTACTSAIDEPWNVNTSASRGSPPNHGPANVPPPAPTRPNAPYGATAASPAAMVASVPTMSSTHLGPGPPADRGGGGHVLDRVVGAQVERQGPAGGVGVDADDPGGRQRPQQLDGERAQPADADDDRGRPGAADGARPGRPRGGLVAPASVSGPATTRVEPAERDHGPRRGGHDVAGQAAVAPVAPAGEAVRAHAVVTAAAGRALAARGRRDERHRLALGAARSTPAPRPATCPAISWPSVNGSGQPERLADLAGHLWPSSGRSGTGRCRPPRPAPRPGPGSGTGASTSRGGSPPRHDAVRGHVSPAWRPSCRALGGHANDRRPSAGPGCSGRVSELRRDQGGRDRHARAAVHPRRRQLRPDRRLRPAVDPRRRASAACAGAIAPAEAAARRGRGRGRGRPPTPTTAWPSTVGGLVPGHQLPLLVRGRRRPGRRSAAPARCRPRATRPFRMAVVCCADYSRGHFAAYRALADEDVDLVLHVGDYIYETRGKGTVRAGAARPRGASARRLPHPLRPGPRRRRPARPAPAPPDGGHLGRPRHRRQRLAPRGQAPRPQRARAVGGAAAGRGPGPPGVAAGPAAPTPPTRSACTARSRWATWPRSCCSTPASSGATRRPTRTATLPYDDPRPLDAGRRAAGLGPRAGPGHDPALVPARSRRWCSTAWSCRSRRRQAGRPGPQRLRRRRRRRPCAPTSGTATRPSASALVEAIAERGPGRGGACRATSTRPGRSRGRAPAGTATGRPGGRGVRRPVRHRHADGPPAPARVAQAARPGGRAAARGPLVRAGAPRLHGRSRSTRCRCGTTGTRSTPRTPRPGRGTAPRGRTGGTARGASSRSRSATTPTRRSGRARGLCRRDRRSWPPLGRSRCSTGPFPAGGSASRGRGRTGGRRRGRGRGGAPAPPFVTADQAAGTSAASIC